MKLGIMQPYFLPYLGYWQLMNAVDTYIVYDDVNYIMMKEFSWLRLDSLSSVLESLEIVQRKSVYSR